MNRKYLNYLFLLVPLVVSLSSLHFLPGDAKNFFRWYLVVFALGIVFLPFSAYIFKNFNNIGYIFSKPLSIVLSGFAVWTFSYLKILPFRLLFVILILSAFALVFYINPKTRTALTDRLSDPRNIRSMALQESLFAAALVFWSFARGLKPLLDSLEKPMNYGFMMSILRTDYLPAQDMWYAGGEINYYYFGHFIYAYLTRLSGLEVEVSYNLALATTFALTLTLSFALCYMLMSFAQYKGAKLFKAGFATSGIVGAFLVTLAGNSHSFFFGSHYSSVEQREITAPGYRFLEFLNERSLLSRFFSSVAPESGVDPEITIRNFWFANSTRFIGYNPPTSDKTIHEFPYYSFLVADLHAHLINLSFVLLLIGILIVILRSKSLRKEGIKTLREDGLVLSQDKKESIPGKLGNLFLSSKTYLYDPCFLLCGLLLGIFMMCNFWDFAIYIVVIAMTLLVSNLRACGKLGSPETVPVFIVQIVSIMVVFLFAKHPAVAVVGYVISAMLCIFLSVLIRNAFTLTGAGISLLFLISHFIILPFNLNFDPMSKSIALAQDRTPVFQLAIMWGVHILLGSLFLVYVIHKRTAEKTSINGHALYAKGPVARFLSGMNPADIFVCGIFVCGIMFVVMPEVFYVVDIYSGDYKRANTMFKFTYQAFVMLSLAAGYGIARITFTRNTSSKVDFRWSFVAVLMAGLLIIPSYYTRISTHQWLGKFSLERYIGLNGIEGLQNRDRLDAIRWINDNIENQPVLLEAYGDSYTEYNQISAYTGLPTIMGWQTHQWLWRTSRTVSDAYNQVVRPRQIDVAEIYNFTERDKVLTLLDKYGVEYIVVGNLEKEKFPEMNEEQLQTLGDIVFQNDSLYIISIN